jgi:hypothetical protein
MTTLWLTPEEAKQLEENQALLTPEWVEENHRRWQQWDAEAHVRMLGHLSAAIDLAIPLSNSDGEPAKYVMTHLKQECERRFGPPPRYPKKEPIRQVLRTQVYERDAYRCVACGGYERLTCDHITPESRGGATTFENLQTMCHSCNSRKGARV